MIAVDAALTAESAGLRIRVDGVGHVLVCRVDGDAGTLLQTLRRSGQLLATLRLLIPLLNRTGLRLDVMSGAKRVAHIGTGVRSNALGRLLRLPSAHIGS